MIAASVKTQAYIQHHDPYSSCMKLHNTCAPSHKANTDFDLIGFVYMLCLCLNTLHGGVQVPKARAHAPAVEWDTPVLWMSCINCVRHVAPFHSGLSCFLVLLLSICRTSTPPGAT
jgi:hypothetical protein